MIRVLTGGYRDEDYKFLKETLTKSYEAVRNNCTLNNKSCVYCKNRRACLDIDEVIDFLNKGGEKK